MFRAASTYSNSSLVLHIVRRPMLFEVPGGLSRYLVSVGPSWCGLLCREMAARSWR